MELIVNLSREDIWQFVKFMNLRTPYSRLNLVLNTLTYPLILLFLQSVSNIPLDRSIALILIVTIIWIPSYVWLWKSRVKKTPSDKGDQIGARTIGITPDRIYVRAAWFEEFHAWQGVLDIAQNRDYIFVFTDAHKAYLIPKRSFSNTGEAQSFADTALAHWRAARA